MAELPDVDFSTVRKLDAGDVRLLWVTDWYDGPLEALVEHEGRTLPARPPRARPR